MIKIYESQDKTRSLLNAILEIREDARQRKDYLLADRIRNGLNDIGIKIMDGKNGSAYEITPVSRPSQNTEIDYEQYDKRWNEPSKCEGSL